MKVALVGRKSTGKRLVSLHLVKKHKFKAMPLSYGVERIYKTLFYTEKYSRVPWEHRQKIYDALYDVDPNIWTHFLEKRLKTTVKPNIIVDDVRYVNEVQTLQQMGFLIIRVDSPDLSKQRNITKSLAGSRPGSVIVNEYFGAGTAYKVDYAIYNDTREGTRKATDVLIEELKRRGY